MDASDTPQEHRLAALADGLLTPGCGNTCAGSSPQTPLDVRYTPWGDGDPVTIDLTSLDAHHLAENKALRLLPIPGAVIAYQQFSKANMIGVFVALS